MRRAQAWLVALPDPCTGWVCPAAEMCAERLGISRQQQDDHAVRSVERARAATAAGQVDWEVAPVEVPAKGGSVALVKEVGGWMAVVLHLAVCMSCAGRQGGGAGARRLKLA